MADNTPVKDAADQTVTIGTDEVSSVHYQRVKLLDGTADSTAAIPGDATNGLDVDVTRVVPGTDATHLGKAEDAQHASGDVGVMALAVRTDTAAARAGTTGDYIPLTTDALGNLRVALTDTTGADLDYRQENENWNAADHGVLMFGRDTDSTPNKYRALNLSAEGDLHVDLSDINGVEPSVGAGNSDTGTLRVVLATNQAAVTVAQGTASNLKAEVSNGGTFAVQAAQSVAANLNCTEASASAIKTAVELIDDAVIADDAGFTPATTKLHMAGFTLDDTATDVVDEADAGAARITNDRKQIVVLGESGANYVKGGGSKTDQTAQSIMAASGDANISNYLCWFACYNSSATNTWVEIRDGTTTVVLILPLPAYGGAVFQPSHPIKGTGNTAFNAYAGASVTTAYFYGGGYKGR